MPPTSQSPKTRRRSQPVKRSYVACIPCRTRKVKCVIGSHPPCAKCEREHRECLFDVHERSWKHREAPKWAGKLVANASTNKSEASTPESAPPPPSNLHQQQPLPPCFQTSASPTVSQHVATPASQASAAQDHSTTPAVAPQDDAAASASPSFTDRVVSSIVTGPSDALAILFDAANGSHTSGLPMNQPHGTSPRLEFTSHPIPVVSQLSYPHDHVLDLWDKCRFVRQGWFTAQEAVTYVDLFYQYFAPLSTVVSDLYKAHDNHSALVCEEPMLCCTILMIASRYFILPGAGGHSRSNFIHQRLWQYCELLIRRVICGQEKHSTAKTRVLGTIESLLLTSDWHPRAVHFPPETEGWDGWLISPAYDRSNRIQQNGESPLIRWREDVFEPSKRCERMSWMLLGCAVNLAYELGVFAEKTSVVPLNQTNDQGRRIRLQKTLYIYVTQMANRMGCGSMLPDNLSSSGPLTSNISVSSNSWDIYTDLWVALARLTKAASTMFFSSPEHTKQTVISGQYAILLEHFSPSLEKWKDDFTKQSEGLHDPLKRFLVIEFCYLRAYTNALSIQAVVEQALASGIRTIDDCRNGALTDLFRTSDLTFIEEVLSASQEILGNAADLASEGNLRYAPLRVATYITSSSVFLLKAIFLCRAAGVHTRGTSWESHLQTLERAIVALRSSAIDDMDFSSRFATLIEKHVRKLHACAAVDAGLGLAEKSNSDRVSPGGLVSSHVSDDSLLPHGTSSGATDGVEHGNATGPSGAVMLGDSWLTLPFDSTLAPFTSDHPPFTLGFQADSLDFLWNLTEINFGG